MGLSKLLYSTLALFATLADASYPRHASHNHFNPRSPGQNVSDYTAHDVPHFTFDELYNMTETFFTAFTYPNNVAQAKQINSSLFSPDVLGRIDVTRNFPGRELNTEYGFGLFANIAQSHDPTAFSLLGVPIHHEIIHFTANQNIFSASVLIDFNITALGVVSPVEVIMFGSFNRDRQLSQYDATFRYLEWQFSWLFGLGMKKFNIASQSQLQDLLALRLAGSICSIAQRNCQGPNKQYDSPEDCKDFLTKDIRFGSAYELGMNTLLCRMVHQNMVPFRPSLHCPHIGKTGGGYCNDDRTYVGNVLQPLFTHQPLVPFGKASRNASVAPL